MADPDILPEDLENGGSFGDSSHVFQNGKQSRRAIEGDVECLDMEIVIGNQNYVITIFPDSDPDALAHEFAA